MLHEVHLRGLGVIAEASVEFASGLNVVTGETGVGKTLLVTSLDLLTGGRGAARLVAEGAKEAVVQAVADGPDGEELILVRRLGADGRSRASIDGELVPIAALQEVGARLIEIHGQGAGFALARPAMQLAAIDALAETGEVLERYRSALSSLRALERERDALATGEAARAREIDVLTYQVDEIDRAALGEDEEDRVLASIARLEHAERLGSIGQSVVALVGAEGAAGELAGAHRELETAVAFDPDVATLVERLGAVAAEAAELGRDVRAWAESISDDPSQLEALRERKALIASLRRKYGATLAEVIAFAERSRTDLASLASSDARVATIDAEVAEARTNVERIAADLTKRRKRACKRLQQLVSEELPALALPKAVFVVDHETCEPTESGADRITFRFSSSSSKTPDDIGKIASGGELSRAMVAVTLALAQAHAVGVLVFDEADAGVGGEAALELGRRLQRLGRSHQVLVVSHLPQIAAFADRHIVVRRSGDEVTVATLDDDERAAEISRMLAGLGESDLARAHATELLELAAAG